MYQCKAPSIKKRKVVEHLDNEQLENCFREHEREIYSFCKFLTQSREEAEDLFQDTFLLATQKRREIDFSQNPKGYLLSVAIRIWKNKKRKWAWRNRIADCRNVTQEWELPEDAETESFELPEEKLLLRERDEIVRKSVLALPEKLRIVTLLYYMEELPVAEIATALGIPRGTVLSRLHLARKMLCKELEGYLHD